MPAPNASFFVVGGTLGRDVNCYVHRKADEDIYEALHKNEFCYVLTSRQMGKSSLMVRTAARLRADGFAVAVLDLTALGQNVTAEQWYGGFVARLGEQLYIEDELEDYWNQNDRLGPLGRLIQMLRDVLLKQLRGRVVIFVDEIDSVRNLPFSTDEFFAGIRLLYNGRAENADLDRLTFCLLGVATPSDLIRDVRMTPFNIGTRIELSDFSEEEALETLGVGLGKEPTAIRKLVQRILYWTGGHPYLTQRLCQQAAGDSISVPTDVDRLCEQMFLSTAARGKDDNLLFVRERILRAEADRASLLDLYLQVRRNRGVRSDETNPLATILRLSGITRVVQGCLLVRNRIYYRVFDQRWAKDNLPDSEVRRQRAAFLRGFMQTSAVAGVLLALLSSLAYWGWKQAHIAKQQEQIAQQQEQNAIAKAKEANIAWTNLLDIVSIFRMMLAPRLLEQRLKEGDEHAELVKGLQAQNRTNPDYPLAKRYFEESAKDHYGVAESLLGDMYANGSGVKRDDKIAFQHFLTGATSAHPSARSMFTVGRWYQLGRYVKRDPQKAIEWYARAAELGSGDAPAYAGYMYLCGDGVPQDNSTALIWFQRGEELASGRSVHALSWMYENGVGVPRDSVLAKRWKEQAERYEFVSDDPELKCEVHRQNVVSAEIHTK